MSNRNPRAKGAKDTKKERIHCGKFPCIHFPAETISNPPSSPSIDVIHMVTGLDKEWK